MPCSKITRQQIESLLTCALSGSFDEFWYDLDTGFNVDLRGTFDQQELEAAIKDLQVANNALSALRLAITAPVVTKAMAEGGYTDLGSFRVLAVRPSINGDSLCVKCTYDDVEDGDGEGYVYLYQLNGRWVGEF